MKKVLILISLFVVVSLFSQSSIQPKKKYKKLKSNTEIKETVVIRKPDISTVLKRKETVITMDMKVDVKEKIRNSNKLLY